MSKESIDEEQDAMCAVFEAADDLGCESFFETYITSFYYCLDKDTGFRVATGSARLSSKLSL